MVASNVKQEIKSVIDMTLLPPIHLNADLWTRQVTGEKFLGVRVFWKVGKVLKSALLAVTAYNPPKIEDKGASEWLLEYILAVLRWYGVRAADVSGATSDAGPDCKKVFNVWAHSTWVDLVVVRNLTASNRKCIYIYLCVYQLI